MKQILRKLPLKAVMTFLTIACFQIILPAQTEGSGSSSGTAEHVIAPKGSGWVASPWVLVAGAVVLVLLLVALLRRGNSGRTTAD